MIWVEIVQPFMIKRKWIWISIFSWNLDFLYVLEGFVLYRVSQKVRTVLRKLLFKIDLSPNCRAPILICDPCQHFDPNIDLNRLRRYRALEFRQPVTQGKHSVKRSLYKALHKRLSLVLRRWRPARTISYMPFVKHQRFAVWSLYRFIAH